MSKSASSAVKHMSPAEEDHFEEKLQGEDFGSIHDWAADLGIEVLKIEERIEKSAGGKRRNQPVINLLEKRLCVLNAALAYLDGSPKAAMALGNCGGLKAIIAYIVKKAQEKQTEDELAKYIKMVKPQLPGVKLSGMASVMGAGKAPASSSSKISVEEVL